MWDSARHAQAQGLARRIQSAAKLRIRHRAWAENNKSIKYYNQLEIEEENY